VAEHKVIEKADSEEEKKKRKLLIIKIIPVAVYLLRSAWLGLPLIKPLILIHLE